jgi:hypothetical protein
VEQGGSGVEVRPSVSSKSCRKTPQVALVTVGPGYGGHLDNINLDRFLVTH